MSIATTWGTDEHERSLPFPCDRHLECTAAAYYRGVTIDAPPHVVFRWLCQMRVAPYSYDWIDNLGRRSPQTLTPGLNAVAVGQRFSGPFELAEFQKDVQLTFRTVPDTLVTRVFGEQAVTYLVLPSSQETCRLLVKYLIHYPRGPLGWLMRLFLPWGDLVMMRRQLLNFKELSQATTRSGVEAGAT